MKDLEAFIDMLRAKGVTAFKGPIHGRGEPVEIFLGPAPGLPDEPTKATAEPEKLRDDGLTAQQAADMYLSSGG